MNCDICKDCRGCKTHNSCTKGKMFPRVKDHPMDCELYGKGNIAPWDDHLVTLYGGHK